MKFKWSFVLFTFGLLKNKVSKIVGENRNIQQWLQETERTIMALYSRLKRCEAMSNPKQSLVLNLFKNLLSLLSTFTDVGSSFK